MSYLPITHRPGKAVKVFGREIGRIMGDEFIKYADANRHMLRDPKGWAIDKKALDRIKKAGVKQVVIIDINGRKTYRANLEEYWVRGRLVDRGYGEQRVLPMEYWSVHVH